MGGHKLIAAFSPLKGHDSREKLASNGMPVPNFPWIFFFGSGHESLARPALMDNILYIIILPTVSANRKSTSSSRERNNKSWARNNIDKSPFPRLSDFRDAEA
jgi:hypothetical protein